MIAKFFQTVKDYRAAVEFCIIAGMHEEAFIMAQTHSEMEFYAELVKEGAAPEKMLEISAFFERTSQYYLAGKYAYVAGDYQRAMRSFVQCRNDEKAIEMAVEMV